MLVQKWFYIIIIIYFWGTNLLGNACVEMVAAKFSKIGINREFSVQVLAVLLKFN